MRTDNTDQPTVFDLAGCLSLVAAVFLPDMTIGQALDAAGDVFGLLRMAAGERDPDPGGIEHRIGS